MSVSLKRTRKRGNSRQKTNSPNKKRKVEEEITLIDEPIQGGNTVVLYLSGHGSEDLDDNAPIWSCKDTYVQTLSFAGHIGTLGILGPNPIPGIMDSFDSASLAVIVNKYVGATNPVDHRDIMRKSRDGIISLVKEYPYLEKQFYEKPNYARLHPFQILSHVLKEREYTFNPNLHENCIECKAGPDDDESKCSIMQPLRRLCPFYGLSIINAAHNVKTGDMKHSFAGLDSRTISAKNEEDMSPEEEERYINEYTYGNLHHNDKIKQYWSNRIKTTKTKNKKIKNQIIEIFEKLVGHDKKIKLSEICTLFNFLGYQNIFIYDPSCRDSDKIGEMISSMFSKNDEAKRVHDDIEDQTSKYKKHKIITRKIAQRTDEEFYKAVDRLADEMSKTSGFDVMKNTQLSVNSNTQADKKKRRELLKKYLKSIKTIGKKSTQKGKSKKTPQRKSKKN
jgi:hypothetical protein